MSGCIIIYVTVPDKDTAQRIAEDLLEKKLVACVNVTGGLESVYRWKGALERSGELLLIMKTLKGHFGKVRDRVAQLHGYEVPEIISVDISDGHGPYLDWIKESVIAEGL